MKWLFALWVREWNYWEKQLTSQLRAELAFLVAVFLIFVVNKSLSDRVSGYILSMPDAVKAFWGLPGNVIQGDPLIFLRWSVMPLNVWLAWKFCGYSIGAVWREEDGGSIFLLCNQWYSRYQIGIAKYTWSVVNFVFNYSLLFIAISALILLGNYRGAQQEGSLGVIWGVYLKGILVITMMISLCCCRAMLRARKRKQVRVELLVLGTLAIGNFHKLIDLSALWMERAGRDHISLIRWLGWTDGLKCLSPLSWLNPFVEYGIGKTVLQVVVSILVSAGAAALGLLGYRVRGLGQCGAEESVE